MSDGEIIKQIRIPLRSPVDSHYEKLLTYGIKFTPSEWFLMAQIAKRGEAMGLITGETPLMDIAMCHRFACPLNLSDFLSATDDDFATAYLGIGRFLDRRTLRMMDEFKPRYALVR